jgi:hypothetical protein
MAARRDAIPTSIGWSAWVKGVRLYRSEPAAGTTANQLRKRLVDGWWHVTIVDIRDREPVVHLP